MDLSIYGNRCVFLGFKHVRDRCKAPDEDARGSGFRVARFAILMISGVRDLRSGI